MRGEKYKAFRRGVFWGRRVGARHAGTGQSEAGTTASIGSRSRALDRSTSAEPAGVQMPSVARPREDSSTARVVCGARTAGSRRSDHLHHAVGACGRIRPGQHPAC